MLGVFFAIVVFTLLLAHYVFVERPRRKASGTIPIRPRALWKAMGRQPQDIFVQPTCTWARLRADGQVEIGVHPLITGLVGEKCESRLLSQGTHLAVGDELARVGRDGRWLTVRSPVAGTITAANPEVEAAPSWAVAEPRGAGWLYRMDIEGLADHVAGWLVADRALEWTKQTYRAIRDHLAGTDSDRSVGLTMADGGALPAGILADLDSADWETFQETFLG